MVATEVKAEQRTEEWHAARAGRATASKFNTIIVNGTGSATYAAEIALERITGRVKETYQSKAMQNGTDTEPVARLEYELSTGNVVKECGFYAHNSLLCGASPDGLVNDEGLVEIKCPNESTHLKTLHTGKIPNDYYWQMIGQMWMTGRKWCDYVSYHPDFPSNSQLYIHRIERDEGEIQRLEWAVKDFLETVDREEQFIRQYNGKPNQVTVTRIKK